jgi:hypothetical protein
MQLLIIFTHCLVFFSTISSILAQPYRLERREAGLVWLCIAKCKKRMKEELIGQGREAVQKVLRESGKSWKVLAILSFQKIDFNLPLGTV